MKTYLSTLLRHAFTALAGLGGFLLSKGLIDSADVAQVNGAGVSLGAALAVIVSAIAGRFLLTLLAKIFTGAGESGSTASVGKSLLLMCATAAGLMGFLPSCATVVTKTTTADGTVVLVTAKSSDAVAVNAALNVSQMVIPLLIHPDK